MPRKGYKQTEEHRRKISENNARYWKGKNTLRKGTRLPEEHRARIAEALKGNVNGKGNVGHTASEESRRKNAEAHRRLALVNPNYGMRGKQHSIETRKRISKAKTGRDDYNPNESYGYEFTKALKLRIMERDSHSCQMCWEGPGENGSQLVVHHIDHDKQHNAPRNLVALCRRCHGVVDGNANDRGYWQSYLEDYVALAA